MKNWTFPFTWLHKFQLAFQLAPMNVWSTLCGWGFLLNEGCAGAKGTPLSMWQVRVWWADWNSIWLRESVFTSCCQSTDRNVWPISQAQVWSGHPQSSRMAVPPGYHHHITNYWKKKLETPKIWTWICANYYLRCLTFSDEHIVCKVTSTCCINGSRAVGHGSASVRDVYASWTSLSQQWGSLICWNLPAVLCWSELMQPGYRTQQEACNVLTGILNVDE